MITKGNRNQYYRTLQHKMRVQIPFRDQISDSRSNCQLHASQDLLRMKELLTTSNYHQQSASPFNNPNAELIILNNKRQRNLTPIEQLQSGGLNLTKLGLRKVLQEQKVKIIIKNFINKIKRNATLSQPVEFYPYVADISQSIFNSKGIEIPKWFDLSFSFLSIIQIFILIFVYTLSLVFVENFIDQGLINTLQTFSMCFYTIQIVINFISIKTIQGRKVLAIRQIFFNYIKRKFFIDLLCLIILIVDINTKFSITNYLRLCVVLKIRECLQKMQKIQNVFVNNFYKEQYWSLIKVFLVNFGFAHVLAVLLLAMAKLDTSNWLKKVNLIEDQTVWYELYSWAYYWGTTIMLTVGFGDLSASNYKQALCLTVIETFSCILLAYNINCVGNLINNIRSQGLEKTKNFRVMRKLVENNLIDYQLEQKVCNFIDESDKMKKQFGFEDQKQFVSKLPPQLKAQFLKQSNIKIFKSISFFRIFTEKTLLNLAQSIEVKIAHPEQIIFKPEDDPKYLILKQGKVGFCTKLSGSDFSGTLTDKLKINKRQSPMILYLNFLSENIRNVKYKIKSLHYSMVYFMSINHVLEIMKNSASDFENYCRIRDKSKHIIDEFQILKCEHCPTKHTKMGCPKLHYIPMYQCVVYRFLQRVKMAKNQRIKFERKRQQNFLSYICPLKTHQSFLKFEDSVNKSRKKTNKRLKDEGSVKMQQFDIKTRLQNLGFKLDGNSTLLNGIVNILTPKTVEDECEQFEWDVQSDCANNYKFYFSQCNSSTLSSKVVLKQRFQKACKTFRDLSKVLLDIND